MSVVSFREVPLEIVRTGKQHNQLLSPLTPYMALCGEGSPITFHIEFEHHQLLNRLERLRYMTQSGDRFASIPTRVREAEVADLGTEIARVLSKIETLSTELARAQRSDGVADTIVHLRIVVSGSELSLIPFEMAIAPLAYPGEGLEFCLQASLPIVVTREIRRSRPLAVRWNQTSKTLPKVLLVYAEPDGMKVPAKAHIQAIREALEPWIRRLPEPERTDNAEDNNRKRLKLVKNRLRLLPNASIDDIYNICAKEQFTHVHILAHGDTYENAGVKHFGVALCKNGSSQKEVVSGKRLAKALQAEGALGASRSQPLVVTLATCDSGNQADVLVPGGSIAHDLHVEGIPWVFASQFPLTVPGSVRVAQTLYPRLFRGDDPRQILFELRRQLYQGSQNDHDWASIVAYAALSRDFSSEVAAFCSRQIREAINVSLEYADSLAATADTNQQTRTVQEVQKVIDEVEGWLHTWEGRKPTGQSADDRLRRSEIIGMHGSTYKRMALLLAQVEGDKSENFKRDYRKALDYYRQAMGEAAATGIAYYWTATQYLSLQAMCGLKGISAHHRDPETYDLARRLASLDMESNQSNSTRAWAHGTLAELALLGAYHSPFEGAQAQIAEHQKKIEAEVENHCSRIVALMGPRSFHVGSTLRQFKRYVGPWQDQMWQDIANKAIKVLAPEDTPETEFDYPEDE
jgi:hypothetical protein